MRRSFTLLAALVLLPAILLGCSGPGSAPSRAPAYAVHGMVKDKDGQPLEGVSIVSSSGRLAVSNSSGLWSMSGLRGTNRISASLDGWSFDPPEHVVTGETRGLEFVGTANFTPVQGLIASDTTWTLEGSPYRLAGDVRIDSGARLTIEPGVRVYGGSDFGPQPRIEVRGELFLEGAPGTPVSLNNVWVIWSGGRIHARHAVIRGGRFADTDGSGSSGLLTLLDSQLIDVSNSLYLRHAPHPTHIERNVFVRSPGILVFLNTGKASEWPDDGKVYIRNNVFYEPPRGGRAPVQLELNYPDDVVVRYNSFLSTDRVAVWAPKWDVTENFWNTTDPAEIELMINDRFPGTSGAKYDPFLREPHPDTPPLPDPVPPPVRY